MIRKRAGTAPAQPLGDRPAPPAACRNGATTVILLPATASFRSLAGIALVVVFQPNLPLADMKARLVLNRLSTKARILSTDPPVERLDDIDPLTKITVYPDR